MPTSNWYSTRYKARLLTYSGCIASAYNHVCGIPMWYSIRGGKIRNVSTRRLTEWEDVPGHVIICDRTEPTVGLFEGMLWYDTTRQFTFMPMTVRRSPTLVVDRGGSMASGTG